MQVSSLNEVKIYSLSCGKSLPEVSQVGSSSSREAPLSSARSLAVSAGPWPAPDREGPEVRDGTWGSWSVLGDDDRAGNWASG